MHILDKKSWTFFGDMFIKLPTEKTKALIEKGKQKNKKKIFKCYKLLIFYFYACRSKVIR